MSGDVNGAELALRIAYFDVVGKWRRSQEKCKYLEESRNLLVKELIRIKQVNEDLLKENSALAASLESSASLPNRTEVATSRTMRQAKSHSPLVPGSSADRMRQDEQDLEQITQRLLNELQKEIARSRTKHSPHPVHLTTGCSDKKLLIDDDTGVAANNSVGSELVVANQPMTPTERSDHMQWTKKGAGDERGGNGSIPVPRTSTPRIQVQAESTIVAGDETKTASESGSGSRVEDKHQEERDTGESTDVKDQDSLTVIYAKIIASLTADLNKATQRIVSQNEKLSKLKSRQLRSYFRRQLKGEDQISGNNIPIVGSGSRCHTEHV